MNIIFLILTFIPVSIATLYVLEKINKNKVSGKKLFFTLMFLEMGYITNSYVPLPIIKPILSFFMFCVINFFVFKQNNKLTFLYSFYASALFLISEVIFGMIMMGAFEGINMMEYNTTNLGCFVSNTIVAIISIVLINIYKIVKFIPNIANNLVTLKTSSVILLLSLLFVSINILFFMFYYKYVLNASVMYATIAILFVIYTVIILFYMRTMDNYNQVKERYTVSLKGLKEYEKILERYRIETHENKNHLNIISEMKDIKDVKKYVKTMLNKVPEENDRLLNKVALIPEGGLRAVFYTKLMIMEEENIEYSFNVGRKIHAKDFLEMDDQCLLDICNIINVFLDNAIHSTLLSSKPMMLIDITSDCDEIEIFISNSYEGEIKVSDVKKNGFTTKGDGHGYGLTLVEETLNRNSRLINETLIKEDIFNQILKIKIKGC